mmetsp:Transcript_14174/g.40137  ORF Transcript_14174/g.40137 Transcript_14174/m.40137 type:complete len:480 (-) Transcript_14174:147-1586(-)
MASVMVQVGQCGNQLGEALLEELYAATVGAGAASGGGPRSATAELAARRFREAFFRADPDLDEEEELLAEESRRGYLQEPVADSRSARPGARPAASRSRQRVARAVLLDMEPRVIDECLRHRRRWRYDPSSAFRLEGGSGNNWAQGFCKRGPAVRDSVVEILRREAEGCDRLDTFSLVQSGAGGTGSGLGTYLTGVLRDEFPSATVLNCLVWPLSSGEVVVQDYNAALTIAELQKCSHGMMCLFNDHARYVCQKLEGVDRPEMHDLNRVLARDLASSLFVPSHNAHGHWALGQLVRNLVPLPALKCLLTQTVPQMSQDAVAFSNHSWKALTNQLSACPVGWPLGDESATIRREHAGARLVTLRGRDAVRGANFDHEAAGLGVLPAAFETVGGYSQLQVRHQEVSTTLYGNDRTLSMVSNSEAVTLPLDAVAARGNSMLSASAYVHQYATHGYCESDMYSAFVGIEQIIGDYRIRLGKVA